MKKTIITVMITAVMVTMITPRTEAIPKAKNVESMKVVEMYKAEYNLDPIVTVDTEQEAENLAGYPITPIVADGETIKVYENGEHTLTVRSGKPSTTH